MKIEQLSERTRKIILFGAVGGLGALLLFWWGSNVVEKTKQISFPKVPDELKENIKETTQSLELPSVGQFEIPAELEAQLQADFEDAQQQE